MTMQGQSWRRVLGVTWLVPLAAALLGLALLGAAQAPAPKPSGPAPSPQLPQARSPKVALEPPTLSEPCQAAHERAEQLRVELEAALSPQAKAAAEQYVAKPGPGVDAVKAWGDYAAAALLMDDVQVAAWAGLKAAEIRWNGETATNAGVYLYHLGKVEEALQLLNCAYEMGYRSPYLFEALAVIHQTQGNNAQARQAIQQAQQAAPDDTIIETEASFIQTGQPPPPRPPQRDPDGLDEAVRELEEHAERAVNLMKLQADEIDRSLPDANVRQDQQIDADYINSLVQIARDHTRDARAEADPTLRRARINGALYTCIYGYATITDRLLGFPSLTEVDGSPLLLWADALGLDAPSLARESSHLPPSTGDGTRGSPRGLPMTTGATKTPPARSTLNSSAPAAARRRWRTPAWSARTPAGAASGSNSTRSGRTRAASATTPPPATSTASPPGG